MYIHIYSMYIHMYIWYGLSKTQNTLQLLHAYEIILLSEYSNNSINIVRYVVNTVLLVPIVVGTVIVIVIVFVMIGLYYYC